MKKIISNLWIQTLVGRTVRHEFNCFSFWTRKYEQRTTKQHRFQCFIILLLNYERTNLRLTTVHWLSFAFAPSQNIAVENQTIIPISISKFCLSWLIFPKKKSIGGIKVSSNPSKENIWRILFILLYFIIILTIIIICLGNIMPAVTLFNQSFSNRLIIN